MKKILLIVASVTFSSLLYSQNNSTNVRSVIENMDKKINFIHELKFPETRFELHELEYYIYSMFENMEQIKLTIRSGQIVDTNAFDFIMKDFDMIMEKLVQVEFQEIRYDEIRSLTRSLTETVIADMDELKRIIGLPCE
ncbi:MAG: hypothetical protein J5711_01760 [Bacteroidales bacterium]|nr:hypothetical protein [Bacteroidales bacterium]